MRRFGLDPGRDPGTRACSAATPSKIPAAWFPSPCAGAEAIFTLGYVARRMFTHLGAREFQRCSSRLRHGAYIRGLPSPSPVGQVFSRRRTSARVETDRWLRTKEFLWPRLRQASYREACEIRRASRKPAKDGRTCPTKGLEPGGCHRAGSFMPRTVVDDKIARTTTNAEFIPREKRALLGIQPASRNQRCSLRGRAPCR